VIPLPLNWNTMNTSCVSSILVFVLIGAIQALAKPPIIILPCKSFRSVL
jgi:hypothetical protein